MKSKQRSNNRLISVTQALYRYAISPRFGITLLVLIAALAIIGIFIANVEGSDPGDMSVEAEPKLRGFLQTLTTGNYYQSALFKVLAGLLAADLVLCSVARLRVVTGRFISDPLTRTAIKDKSLAVGNENTGATAIAELILAALKTKRYKADSTTDDGGNVIHARRGRLRLLGSTIVHLGILLALTGAYIGQERGFRLYAQIVQKESFVEPGRNFLVRLDSIEISYFEPESEAQAAHEYLRREVKAGFTILVDGLPVESRILRVGDRLRYDGTTIRIDQDGNGWYYRLRMTNSANLQQTYSVWPWSPVVPLSRLGMHVYMHRFFPDYAADELGNGYSQTPYLRNPAVDVWVISNHEEPVSIGILAEGEVLRYGDYALQIFDFVPYASVYISSNPGMPALVGGLMLFLAGLLIVYLISYRRVIIVITDRGGGSMVEAYAVSTKPTEASDLYSALAAICNEESNGN